MTSFGIVAPGTGSHSPCFQSRAAPCGLAISSGVSCISGTATTSWRVPRRGPASSENFAAIACQASQSVRVCQGGAMAGLKECTNGCMSVVFRSCFSYQVAAGSTTSENSVVLVCRKSIVISRSSLPSGAGSRHSTSRGLREASEARNEESAPSRCLRKYSLPFALEPSRLDRHTLSTRGKFSGASGSSAAKRSVPAFSCSGTHSATALPAAAASSARSCGLLSKVG